MLAWGINGVEDVVLVEAAIAIGSPKKTLTTDDKSIHLGCRLADILVGTRIAVEGEVAYREDDVVNPDMVATRCATTVLLVCPSEHMLTLSDREGYFAPIRAAAPLLDFCIVNIEL